MGKNFMSCFFLTHGVVVLQKKAGLVLGSNLMYSGWEFSLQLDNQSITTRNRHVKIWVLQYWCLHFTKVCDGGLGWVLVLASWVGLGWSLS